MSFRPANILLGLPLLAALLSTTATQAASIQFFDAFPIAISGDGTRVLTAGPFRDRPVIRTVDGGEQPLTELPPGASVIDLSTDGTTVIGEAFALRSASVFRWSEAGGLQELKSGADRGISIEAVSGDGNRVVGLVHGLSLFQSDGIIWESDGQITNLSTDGSSVRMHAISDGGDTLAGQQAIGELSRAVRWLPDGRVEPLVPVDLEIKLSFADTLSGDGRVAFGEFSRDGWRSRDVFMARDGVFESLGKLLPKAVAASINAASWSGRTAVGEALFWDEDFGVEGHSDAVLWDEAEGARTLRSVLLGLGLNLDSVELESAIDISSDGTRIIGRTRDGRTYLATIPQPSAAILMALGLAGLGIAGKRK